MTDISKCRGLDCPLKERCYRYTAPMDEYRQAMIEEPFTVKDGVFTCKMYWGDQSEFILNQLKDITNGKA